jgi:D-alanyl-D-alanine carboxypeptidase/D-alanyl-D-alanine-endopeptidase (penicillin-binding protein 4)
MRRLVIALGLSLVALVQETDAPAQTPSDLENALHALERAVPNAKVGVYVVDLDGDKVLAASGEHTALNPASNAKLVTAAAALALLHPEHRYETTLSGKVKDGAIGPLCLRGFGDPSLEASDLQAMAHELHDRGVRRVDDIVVDQKWFDEKTTPPAFEQKPSEWAAFRAPVSAVAVSENTVILTVRPDEEGKNAHAWFDPPGFVESDGAVSTAGPGADTVTLTLSPNGQKMSAKIGGTIGSDARLVRYARRVEDPTLLAGYVLKDALDTAGIKVAGDVKAGTLTKAPVLVRHTSAPLSELLAHLGKESDNFYAEMIFKSIGAETKFRPGSSDAAAQAVTKWVEEIGASEAGLVVKNGSGLYDSNRISPFSVEKLLAFAWRSPEIGPDYVSQLAIGGADGTLHKRFRTVKGHRALRAKTGTLEGTIALSGYVLGAPGKQPIAFSILFNGVEGHASDARQAIDKFVTKLIEMKQ